MRATLFILRNFDIGSACLVFIEKVVEFVVGRAIYCFALVCLVHRADRTLVVMNQDAFVVAEVGWRLLETIVVRKRCLDLMHV